MANQVLIGEGKVAWPGMAGRRRGLVMMALCAAVLDVEGAVDVLQDVSLTDLLMHMHGSPLGGLGPAQ